MGRAFIELYAATGERKWLEHVAKSVDFIGANFKSETVGYVSSKTPHVTTGVFKKRFVNIEENIRFARLANITHRYTGQVKYRKMSEYAMRYLTSDKIINLRRFLVGIILADDSIAVEPAHITIIGSKGDARAQQLHRAALKLPIDYRRIDFWDLSEGPMPNPDITYPKLDKAAAFACANQICSLPVFEAAELEKAVKRMIGTRVVKRD